MKLFTEEEAKSLLPEVKRLWRSVDQARGVLQQLEPEARLAAAQAADGGGGTVYGFQYAAALNDFLAGVQSILSLGVEIKDLNRGLCDFPHMRDGRVVYLCWQRGEDSIEWWHDIDAGFAGRQPL
ncbi:MAG: DUF2203 domain-containing protein [Acidobacteria bacterium]|nr:DUF2203 domain-containing protein [Acidobacteriota bacterium]